MYVVYSFSRYLVYGEAILSYSLVIGQYGKNFIYKKLSFFRPNVLIFL